MELLQCKKYKIVEKINELDLEANLEIPNQWKSERWHEGENQDENEIHLDNNNELTTEDRDNLIKNNGEIRHSRDSTNTKDDYIKCDIFDRRSIYENDFDGDNNINNDNNGSDDSLSHSKVTQNGISVTVRENGSEQIVEVEIIEQAQQARSNNGIYSNGDDEEIDDEIDIDDQLNSFDDDADANEFNESSELLASSKNSSGSSGSGSGGGGNLVIAIPDENINSIKGIDDECGEIIVINVKNGKMTNKDYEKNDDDDDDSGGVFTNQDDEDKLLCGDGNNNKNIIGWYYTNFMIFSNLIT